MFGYVIADLARLDEGQQTRYKSFYCGLCRALYRGYGPVPALALTYFWSIQKKCLLQYLAQTAHFPEAQPTTCSSFSWQSTPLSFTAVRLCQP